MSVLIKGMDMPKDGRTITITICSSGEVSIGTSTYTKPICKNFIDMMLNYHAVEIPTPHGRLIDADTFIKEWHLGYQCENCENDARRCGWQELTKMDICGMIEDAPTVIESED